MSSTASPIRYTSEIETQAGLNDAFDTILERTAEDYGHAVRSVHAKPCRPRC